VEAAFSTSTKLMPFGYYKIFSLYYDYQYRKKKPATRRLFYLFS